MGNPQQQEKQPETRRDFGELPDIEDLLALAQLDGSDVNDAAQWLEDNAPETARKIGKSE